MKIDQLIKELSKIRADVGDVEVTITDGFNVKTYRGDFQIETIEEKDEPVSVDIGIGGLEYQERRKSKGRRRQDL